MKIVYYGLALGLILLPRVSFAQEQTTNADTTPPAGTAPAPVVAPPAPVVTPQAHVRTVDPTTEGCNERLDNWSRNFFSRQAAERGEWMKNNQAALARHDAHFKAALALDMARRVGKPTTGLENVPEDDATFAAFLSKQQSDKSAFFARQATARAACLAGQTTASTVN